MALQIRIVDYFDMTVNSNAQAVNKLLSKFADVGLSLLAFKAIPIDSKQTRFSLFPEDSSKMKEVAESAGLSPEGPYSALIIKSDSDDPGECAGIFAKLSKVDIHILESSGIADIKDSYGIVLYLNKEDCIKAMDALNV